MAKKSAHEKLLTPAEPVVHVLDDAKAARMKARTMLIPTPLQVRDYICAIPSGQTRTVKELRDQLATDAGADITCPMVAGIFWRVVAEAAEEDRASGSTPIAPWWRLLKDGKPNPKMPGGEENHRSLLAAEGVQV
jgi:hypothetical protein